MVQVGNVTAVAPAERLDLAVSLAEEADQPIVFPGVGRWQPPSLRLVVTGDRAGFQRFGRVPDWGVGLAFPRSRTVVVRADAPNPRAALRHELAHMALHDRIRTRVPLWFDEGYAVVAAGEFDRLLALELNLAVIRGRVRELRDLDAALRRAPAEAQTAYALAGAAVLHLMRIQPRGSLEPFIARLAAGARFDQALLSETGYDLAAFERSWRRDVRRRYGWLVWLAAGGIWIAIGVLVIALAVWRRRRDRPRRAALDEGWVVPESEASVMVGEDPLPPEPSRLDRDQPAG